MLQLDSTTATIQKTHLLFVLVRMINITYILNDHISFHAAGNQSCGEYPNGALRLVDGATSYEGRVELCIDGEWGTICDNFWSDLDAVVVCRQLSLGLSDATAVPGAQYGQGNGTVHLDRFFCSGDEKYLTDCIHRAANNCPHSQDAGVVCSGTCTYATCMCVFTRLMWNLCFLQLSSVKKV